MKLADYKAKFVSERKFNELMILLLWEHLCADAYRKEAMKIVEELRYD